MMMIENFTPGTALIGGFLIGVASILLMAVNGRVAGISGIAGGLLIPRPEEMAWRGLFLAGLILGAGAYGLFHQVHIQISQELWLLILAGVLVGFGTQLGKGCTSGHGVCGIARLSPRSIAATVVFMVCAAVTVYLARHMIGG